jgi:hypothetical protein
MPQAGGETTGAPYRFSSAGSPSKLDLEYSSG